jgi:hypothetical protein
MLVGVESGDGFRFTAHDQNIARLEQGPSQASRRLRLPQRDNADVWIIPQV